MSSPIPGDGKGSCVALALVSSQLEISCGDVDLSLFAGRSSASMLQLRPEFAQCIRFVKKISTYDAARDNEDRAVAVSRCRKLFFKFFQFHIVVAI